MVNLGGATENDRKKIVITKDSKAFFHNNVDYCVGTGRMGLALTEEYQEELRLVQKEIGFKHIRGHGLFCDDMAIFQTYEEDGKVRVEYNYTYLDRVMDAYKKVGLRPFLELGFSLKSWQVEARLSFTGREILLLQKIMICGVVWCIHCCGI